MVNHYYFYCVDEDFGPFFLKFCSYFPYNAKLCINGNEYLKRQLAKRGVAFEAAAPRTCPVFAGIGRQNHKAAQKQGLAG